MKKLIILSTLLALNLTAFSQFKSHLHIYNKDGSLFCGETVLDVKITKKKMVITTDYGDLELTIVDGNIDDFKSWKCVDPQGNIYVSTSIEDAYDKDGFGIQVVPELESLYTFMIFTTPLCD